MKRASDPSQFPELEPYPNLRAFVDTNVDMLFRDAHAMMRLPLQAIDEELDGGCNYALGSWLLGIVSGISYCFYECRSDELLGKTRAGPGVKGAGARFCEVVATYYPWDTESGRYRYWKGASVLWDRARNPLAHRLGMDTGWVTFRKPSGLTELVVASLEELDASRPCRWPTTIVEKSKRADGDPDLDVHIPVLYWGIRQMLRRLFSDEDQARKSDQVLGTMKAHWDPSTRSPRPPATPADPAPQD